MREMTKTLLVMQNSHRYCGGVDEQTLRSYLALCETENTRDAAALLGVNQSSVSRSLARLEADLETELFTRYGRRLELNRAGAVFRVDAAQIVERIDGGRRHLGQLTGPEGVIRVGFLQSMARWALPRLIGGHRQVSPGARFELRQGFARDLFGWIADDALDVALVTPPGPQRTGIGWRLLVEQRLLVAVPGNHRLAGNSSVKAADLDGEDFIAFARSTELRTVIDPLLQAAGARVRIAFESSEIDTIRGLVAAGLGVAIIPAPSTTDASDPVYVPLVPSQARQLGLAWSTQRSNPDSVVAFLEGSGAVRLGE